MDVRILLALVLIGGLCLTGSPAGYGSGANKLDQTTKSRPKQNRRFVIEKLSDLPSRDKAYYSRYHLQFVTEKIGWLHCRNALWRTKDGGETWELIFQPMKDPTKERFRNDAEISKVQFINKSTGWMKLSGIGLIKTKGGLLPFDQKDPLLKTTDGGLTWSLSLLHFDYLADFHFLADGRNGYVAGSYWNPRGRDGRGGHSDSYFFQTADGGKTWHRPAVGLRSVHVSELKFVDKNQGWVLFGNGIYRYARGRWIQRLSFRHARCGAAQTFPQKEYPDLHVRHLDPGTPLPNSSYFINESEGWIGFTNGDLLHTKDGGQTWCRTLNPAKAWRVWSWISNSLSQIYFSDSLRGWMRNVDSELYETKDGGKTVSRVDVGVEVEDMYFLDARRGWIVAKDGIFRLVL
jgi:photosystem II stability/assembly factor-like uncharacterized protein